MVRSVVLCSALVLVAFSQPVFADLPPVVLEFANGAKAEGYLTSCQGVAAQTRRDQREMNSEFFWSDRIDRPYLTSTKSGEAPGWDRLRLGEVSRIDFLPLTATERRRIGSQVGQLPKALVKGTVTFRDGDVRKSMFIVLDITWETAKETGDFHHPLLRAAVFPVWTC